MSETMICRRIIGALFVLLFHFTMEIRAYTVTPFLGNYTLNLTDILLLEKSKRPRARVTFHEKVEGKSGASEYGKFRERVDVKPKRLDVDFKDGKEEKIVLAVMNRPRRSLKFAITVPGQSTYSCFDPNKVGPGPQTIEYYGSVPFSLRTKSDRKSMPTTILRSTPYSSPETFFSSLDSKHLTFYENTDLFPTQPTKRRGVGRPKEVSRWTRAPVTYSPSDRRFNRPIKVQFWRFRPTQTKKPNKD